MSTGKHMMKGKDVSAQVNAKSGAEVQHKTVAQKLYPVRKGLRGVVTKDNMDEQDRRQ